jgi:hypothetical protein
MESNITHVLNIFEKHNDVKIFSKDIIILKYLLNNVTDNCKYEYPNQKIYIYLFILFSNFNREYFLINLDKEYTNQIIKTITNTNVIKVLWSTLN